MTFSAALEEAIGRLLAVPPYQLEPQQRHKTLLSLLKEELAYACEQSPRFRNYVAHWPVDYREATAIASLPYLPAGVFKADPPLVLVDPSALLRTLQSSATTGQVSSRVGLDTTTAKRMTRGVTTIIRDFIGSARRPYLVIDTPDTLGGGRELGARGAAIQGLRAFATEIVCGLKRGPMGDPSLDVDKLLACAARWGDAEVLVYGFTYVIWTQCVLPLQSRGLTLRLPNVRILHSGGWKRLEDQAVTKEVFTHGVGAVFGCAPQRVIDFYGMVENTGVVYPDCEYGNKHVPAFAEVIVREPRTLEPVTAGQQGLAQVCSVLPASFPGFLVLTEDIVEQVADDGCPCGRRGVCFRFVSRVPKAEVRGCGNVGAIGTRVADDE